MIIGITGSVGTGKSTVAAFFKALGADLIDADSLAHGLIKPGAVGYKKVIALFGKSILSKRGTIDRKKLGKIVFEDDRLLGKLNDIVHPEVIKVVKRMICESKSKIIVFDAPLLIEAGLAGLVDRLIVVKAGRAVQIERGMAKTGMKRSDLLARIKAQMPLARKIKMADFVIDNQGSKAETKKQVVNVWKQLLKGER